MDPRIDHFIVRPDTEDGMPGSIVPLIAVDQLPDWIQLAGVPRELDAEQTIGLINLGIVEMEDDSIFEVRLHHDKIRAILNCADEGTGSNSPSNGKAKAKAMKNQKAKKNEEAASKESLPIPSGISPYTEPHAVQNATPQAHPPGRMLSASRHNVANAAMGSQPPNSNSENPLRPHMTEITHDEPRPAGAQRTTAKRDKQPATVFCRNWCQSGTCNWGLQCHFQHRMPATVEGLREVGLYDYPKWYLLMKSSAGSELPGLLDMDTMPSGLGGVQAPVQKHQPTQQQHRQQQQQQQQRPPQHLAQHHVQDPPSLDLGLVEAMSAILTQGGTVSNKQIREMRDLLLRGAAATQGQQRQQQQQSPRPHNNNNSNYANMYTNASVAANAANIRRQRERQQQVRGDMPVFTRVKARATTGDGSGDGVLVPAKKGGWASDDYAGVRRTGKPPGVVTGRAAVGEEKLVDIDSE